MGVVYEALDLEGDNTVALKMLLNVTPSQIHRLKNEFRSLAGLTHPNLVSFEGLFAEEGEWFLTMELVEGVSFLEYVRPYVESSAAPEPSRDTIEDPNLEDLGDRTITGVCEKPKPSRPMPCRIDRLRSAIVQLAVGIETIHRAGKLHRDLKPSNVRVTPEGRLVILDFGLVSALEGSGSNESFAGTVQYMSPEQASGGPLTLASDWYSFGVMLFEALTGRRPFEGSRTAVMLEKQTEPAPPVEHFVSDAPRDLSTLCDDLLSTQPSLRPTSGEILARLGARAPSIWMRSATPSFVGRRNELERLEQRYAALDRGMGAAIFVHGPSGMGKSALIQRFVNRAESRGALVLRGRCYERESLPFKALDSVIDGLTTHLRGLSPQQQQSLIPRRIRALARLFPVLLQVPAIKSAPHEASASDPRELRRVAVSAFVGMLRRLADHQKLILAIDDLQWGDADSGDLIAELLEDVPPLILIGGFQTDDRAASELLSRLQEKQRSFEEIELGPLAFDEARSLALRLLSSDSAQHADRIARESAGIPMFVQELAQHRNGPPPPLDSAISSRIGKLEPDAARMLEVISIAGRPIEEDLCQRAAGVRGNEARVALNALRSANLIRVRAGTESAGLETYHDLIRRSVVRRMATDQVMEAHRRLARALEDLGAASDLLVHHWRAGGAPERAGRHALSAAKKASEALAFERAAGLYRLAIELLGPRVDDISWLHAALGEACANSGRAPEAAQALLEAVKQGATDPASLRSRAVHLLLASGHVEPGLSELDRLLRALEMQPLSRRRGLLELGLRRVRLRLSGLALAKVERKSEGELARIDACWSATTGLALIDMVLAADFHTENLARSARCGDRYRFARALGMEAVLLGLIGGRALPRAQKVMVEAGALIAELDHQHLRGLLAAARGFVAMSCGRWFEMLSEGERGEQMLEQCNDASWGLDISRTLQLWALAAIGKYEEVGVRAAPLVAEAEAKGDRFLSNMLRASPQVSMVWLAKDEPWVAEQQLEEEKRRWSQTHFTLQNYWLGRTRSQIDLYRGDPMAAWQQYEATWRVLLRSTFLRVAHLRVHARSLRARAALAAGLESKRKDLISIALAEARRLQRDDTPWPRAIAERLFALAALGRGEEESAASRLVRSESMFAALGMDAEVAATQRIRGSVVGGSEGASLIATADERLRRCGAKDPARFTATLTGWG